MNSVNLIIFKNVYLKDRIIEIKIIVIVIRLIVINCDKSKIPDIQVIYYRINYFF